MERWEEEQRPAGGRRSRPNGFYPFSSARRRADALRGVPVCGKAAKSPPAQPGGDCIYPYLLPINSCMSELCGISSVPMGKK